MIYELLLKNMELYSVLVTGANRGIGLEFVRQLSRLPKPPRYVFATYRSSGSLGPLTEIKNASKECKVILIKMDVKVLEEVTEARKIIDQTVGEKGLTLLINNAGVAEYLPFPDITEENLLHHFTINTVGPIRVFQEMLPLLQKAASHGSASGGLSASRAAVLNLTSMVGSITRTGQEFLYDLAVPSYKISKAGLNMAMRVFSHNVKDQGILVILMCPGWVKTDMGTERGEITSEESISAILKTLEKLNDSHTGEYMDRFGNRYPF